MSPEFVFSQGLAVAILVAIAVFFSRSLWPWWVERDNAERQRRHEIALLSAGNDEKLSDAVEHGVIAIGRMADTIEICLSKPAA